MVKNFSEDSKKKKRKKFFRHSLLIGGVILILLIFGIFWFFMSSYFKINKVEIFGNENIPAEQISGNIKKNFSGRYYFIFPKNNVLIIPEQKMAENLATAFPSLSEIYFEKRYPARLSVYVKERKPTAVLCNGQDCAFIDNSGYVFERAPYFSGGVFLKFIDQREENKNIKLKTNFLVKDEYEKIFEFKNYFLKAGLDAAEVILQKDGIYRFDISKRFSILVNNYNEPSKCFENLILALNSEIKEKSADLEYIDLRFENKIYYKFKSE